MPSGSDLDALAELAVDGVHDPDTQPFTVAWTDVEPIERARSTTQHHWHHWATWKPESWRLNLVVVLDGVVVGSQGLGAENFATLREATTGSWLGRRHHGRGIGTEMRAAVLHLAFAGLDAQYATSGAFVYNTASLGVSRKLGYVDDGIARHLIRDRPAVLRRLRLKRADWETHRTTPVAIDGLEPCLPYFGATG